MVYSEHDLAYNATNALAINDAQAVHDILMSEISGLLQSNKPALIGALREGGIKIGDDATDEKVAEIVAEAMIRNRQDILRKIWVAIIREKQKYSNANDIVTGALELGTGIVKMAGDITVAKLNADSAKTSSKNALAAARVGITQQILAGKGATDQARMLAQIEREKGKAGAGNVGAIIGGAIALSIIGVIGFILYKKTASGGAAPTA